MQYQGIYLQKSEEFYPSLYIKLIPIFLSILNFNQLYLNARFQSCSQFYIQFVQITSNTFSYQVCNINSICITYIHFIICCMLYCYLLIFLLCFLAQVSPLTQFVIASMLLKASIVVQLLLAGRIYSQPDIDDFSEDFLDESAKGFGRNAALIAARKDDIKFIK